MTRSRNASLSRPHRSIVHRSPLRRAWWRSDEGATTAEFAIVTMAAVAGLGRILPGGVVGGTRFLISGAWGSFIEKTP